MSARHTSPRGCEVTFIDEFVRRHQTTPDRTRGGAALAEWSIFTILTLDCIHLLPKASQTCLRTRVRGLIIQSYVHAPTRQKCPLMLPRTPCDVGRHASYPQRVDTAQ